MGDSRRRPLAAHPGLPLRLALALVCAIPVATAAHSGDSGVVTVLVQSGDAAIPPESLRIVASPASAAGEPLPEAVEATPDPATGAATLRLSGGLVWQLAASAPGIWSERELLLVDSQRAEVRLAVYPRTRARLRLGPGAATPLPASLRARVESPPGSPRVALVSISCPVTERVVTCELPATTVDLVVEVPGHANLYFHGIVAPTPDGLDLGVRELHPGGSVVGRIVDAGGRPINQASVRLSPERSGSALTREFVAALRAVPEVRSGPRGFFQFVRIAPGDYRLDAASERKGSATRSGIGVLDDAERALPSPLALLPPQKVELHVTPALAPGGARWGVELMRFDAAGSLQPFRQIEADDGGVARMGELPAGSYLAAVLDHEGQALGGLMLEVPGPPLVDVVLDLVELVGSIRLGGEPIAAELAFGGWTGLPIARFSADEAGEFAGVVPHPGVWRVDVRAPEVGVERRLEGVLVDRQEGSEPSRVEIELPGTLVAGRVIDEQGRPALGTMLAAVLFPEAAFFPAEVDDEGRFRIRGVGPGTLRIEASGLLRDGRPADADPLRLELAEDSRYEDLELVLRGKRTVRGRVVDSAGGAVVRASVEMMTFRSDGFPLSAFSEETLTGPEGEFELSLSADAAQAIMTTRGGVTTLRSRRVALGGDATLLLSAERAGGELRLALAAPLDLRDRSAPLPVVFQDGVLLFTGLLVSWASERGAPPGQEAILIVPDLAPGEIAACHLTSPAERAVLEFAPLSFAPGPDCERGYLASGGVLELDLR